VLVERLEARQDVADRHRLDRGDRREAEQLERLLVGVDHLAGPVLGGDSVGDAVEDRAELIARLAQLGLGVAHARVQVCVVERDRRARRERLRQLLLLGPEPATRLGGGEDDRAEHPPARGQRQHQRRPEAERPQRRQVLVVVGDGLEERLGDLGIDLRLAAPDHRRDTARGVGVGRVARDELARQRLLLGLAVRDRHHPDRAVGLLDVDDAPVGQERHGEPRQLVQRRLAVERALQRRAGVGHELRAPLLLLEALA
jgi:hypothetical protein